MDPVAALDALDCAIAAGNLEMVEVHAEDLVRWIEKGGFMPCGPHSPDWRGHLTASQFASHMRALAAVARSR